MKLDKIIAVRADKKVYRDGDLAIKVFDEGSKGKHPTMKPPIMQGLRKLASHSKAY